MEAYEESKPFQLAHRYFDGTDVRSLSIELVFIHDGETMKNSGG